MKNKKYMIVFLIGIFFIFSLITFTGCKEKEKNIPGYEINVMSFNIRQNTITDGGVKSWDFRKEYLPNYVKEVNADIICLQEVKQKQYSDISESSLKDIYDVVWYDRGDTEGNAILFNNKFNLLNQEVFWLSETPEVKSKGFGANYFRICVHITLEIKETKEIIEIYNVHLDHISAKARRKGIELVLDRMKNTHNRSIIAGDFNTTREDKCYEKIIEDMQDSKLAKETDDGYTYNNFGGYKTFKSEIDYIFADNSCYIKSYKILRDTIHINDNEEAYYSDHFAILSKIIFTEQ